MRNKVQARHKNGRRYEIPVGSETHFQLVAYRVIRSGDIVLNAVKPRKTMLWGYEDLDMFLHEKYVMP